METFSERAQGREAGPAGPQALHEIACLSPEALQTEGIPQDGLPAVVDLELPGRLDLQVLRQGVPDDVGVIPAEEVPVAVQVGPADGPGPQVLPALPGEDDFPGLRAVQGLIRGQQGLGREGRGPHDLPGLRVHQNPVRPGGDPEAALPVPHLIVPPHVGGLGPRLPGGDVQHVPRVGTVLNFNRRPGQEEDLPVGPQHLMGQAPGVVVVPGEGPQAAEERRRPDPLLPVTVPEYQLLLAEIAVFI